MDNKEIFDAIYDNDVNTIKRYLENGGDPNIKDNDDYSLLKYLILDSKIDEKMYNIIKLLLEYRFNPNIVDKDNETILFMLLTYRAYTNYTYKITKLLLEYGADPNIKSIYRNSGNTAIYEIFNTYEQNPSKELKELILLLLKYGADLTIKDKDGKTPLDMSPKFKQELTKIYIGNLGKLGKLL